MDDDERVLSPEETLRLIEQQGATAAHRLMPDPVPHYLAWGVAWFVGFGVLFLHHGLSGTPYAPVPLGVALALLFGLMAMAMLISAMTMWQLRSPVRGVSQERGMMYGFAWGFGFFAMWMIAVRFGQLLPGSERNLLWASLSMMVVAVLYMAGGAIWLVRPMFVLGAGLAVLNAVGTAAGPGWHALLMSVGAGGGSVVAGLVLRRRMRA
ncbi:transporter [Planomonospora venezuelensis]|uniref:Uncharacterized protein n=1 Tax=Planomonospora venezuelensis TaxID=1999 RepID=A0A841D3W2_PLAVE|nr:transporter [Planomonospora venezuelensis]MBB5964169.1 hypothetical protein [Planomonospora venezuelensis]GIN05359.1 hypothetical protein Pve01_70170 [Planomonospora venezuelensis]